MKLQRGLKITRETWLTGLLTNKNAFTYEQVICLTWHSLDSKMKWARECLNCRDILLLPIIYSAAALVLLLLLLILLQLGWHCCFSATRLETGQSQEADAAEGEGATAICCLDLGLGFGWQLFGCDEDIGLLHVCSI